MADQNCAISRPSEEQDGGNLALRQAIIAAVQLLYAVHFHGRQMQQVLAELRQQHPEPALLQQLCYGTLRWWPRLVATLKLLLDKPVEKLEPQVQYLLLTGLYQLLHGNIPAHAVVQSQVEACRDLERAWACGLVNAILRKWLRHRQDMEQQLSQDQEWLHTHPLWLVKLLQQQWPDDWQQIIQAGNTQPPMHLRVNNRLGSRDSWLHKAAAAGITARPVPFCSHGVHLDTPVEVALIPGFDQGMVSVQDGAAQQAAGLLDVTCDDTVLDACSAPGGKIAHLLEQTRFNSKPVCVERSKKRIPRLRQTLGRLGLEDQVSIIHGDATRPEQWSGQQLFTRIIVDAPCSATGVIRRNPDIKLRPDDTMLNQLCVIQQTMLRALWPLLRPGGKLLYATCSILEQENDAQADAFFRQHPDAANSTPGVEWGRRGKYGIYILPGDNGMDGFYYICMSKKTGAS